MDPDGVFNGVGHNQYGPPVQNNNSTDVSMIIEGQKNQIAHLEQYIRNLENQQRNFEAARRQAQLSQELDLKCFVCQEDACYSCIACKKLFHKKCIDKWLESAPTCPNCRRTVINGRSSV